MRIVECGSVRTGGKAGITIQDPRSKFHDRVSRAASPELFAILMFRVKTSAADTVNLLIDALFSGSMIELRKQGVLLMRSVECGIL
jgi:hypothetical protein